MANVNAPHGLSYLGRTLAGGRPTVESFQKAAAFGTALFIGDAVARAADGTINVTITPGTTLYSGVCLNWGAASTLTDHLVITSPDAMFEAQDDDNVTGTLAVDVGLNGNLVLTAGDALTLLSKHQVARSTEAVTATLDVKILRKYDVPTNDYGPNCRLEIYFNKHRMHPAVAGV